MFVLRRMIVRVFLACFDAFEALDWGFCAIFRVQKMGFSSEIMRCEKDEKAYLTEKPCLVSEKSLFTSWKKQVWLSEEPSLVFSTTILGFYGKQKWLQWKRFSIITVSENSFHEECLALPL